MFATNFDLPKGDLTNIITIGQVSFFSLQGIKNILFLIRNRNKLKGVLRANPATAEIALLAILKFLWLLTCPIFVFDLILKNPIGGRQKIIAWLKGIFFAKVDYVFVIHRDTSGYEKYYKLKPSQFLYVAFKANNFDIKDSIDVADGDYVVALGASQRDYRVFIEAARHLNIKAVIVCSDENAQKHNADVGSLNEYPKNVQRITYTPSQSEWYKWLAGSALVVVPILPIAIQPAGISVYLEAMILKKAVVISSGASTNGILVNEREAMIVPAGDSLALKDAIDRLINDESLKSKISQAGYEYALSLKNDARLRSDIAHEIYKKIS